MLVIGMLLQTDAVAAAVGPRVYCTSCTLGLVLLMILMLVLQLLMVLLYTLPPAC